MISEEIKPTSNNHINFLNKISMNTIQFLQTTQQTTPEDFVNLLAMALIPQLKSELAELFQPKQSEELLTIEEVCKLLKINRSTEARWRAKGTLKASIIEGTVFHFRSQIETLLNENKLT